MRERTGAEVARALHDWAVELVSEEFPSPEAQRRSLDADRAARWWARVDTVRVLVDERRGSGWAVRLDADEAQVECIGPNRANALRLAAVELARMALLFEGTAWAAYLRRAG